jgi:hypothetical protein
MLQSQDKRDLRVTGEPSCASQDHDGLGAWHASGSMFIYNDILSQICYMGKTGKA